MAWSWIAFSDGFLCAAEAPPAGLPRDTEEGKLLREGVGGLREVGVEGEEGWRLGILDGFLMLLAE